VIIMAKATGPTYRVAFRRRRENRTDYEKRLRLVKGGLPRMVVRYGKEVIVQFVEYSDTGDRTLAAASSGALKKFGWAPRANVPTAYLTGMYAAALAKKKGVKGFVLDMGLKAPVRNALPFAAQKGAIDGGLESPQGKGMVDEGRITGAHIEEYAKSLSAEDFKKKFSSYEKEGFDPKEFIKLFGKAKEAILKEA